MRVEMTFRRLYTADGIANYFWKARPVRGLSHDSDDDSDDDESVDDSRDDNRGR
jgi:hypothetical protein